MTDRQAIWLRIGLVGGLVVVLIGLWFTPPAQRLLEVDPSSTRFEQAAQAWTPFFANPEPLAAGARWLAAVPDDSADWLPVALPNRVRGDDQAGAGPAKGIWWYRIRYQVPSGVSGPLAVYIPRVSGASVLVARREDRWLMRWDGDSQWREQWNRPVLADLGPAPEPGAVVELAIGLVPRLGHLHRVGRISVGPRDQMLSLAEWRNLLQITAPQVGSLTFVSLGLISFVFWLGRRVDRAYLLFALTSVAWLLRNLHYYITMPTDPDVYQWFWWMSNASLAWVMVLTYLFALRFDGRRYPRVELILVLFVTAATVVAMPWHWPVLASLAQLHLVNALVGLIVLSWLGWMSWHGGSLELRIITLALFVTDVAGLHDLMLLTGVVSPESIYLLPIATLAIFAAFLYAVQTRYADAIWRFEQANQELEQRLAQREDELRANHERLRGIEKEQALLLERQRLMRDMHDGLGSTLMSSLVLVEQGKLSTASVAGLLRECVDDLRLVIDSLEPIGHDLVTLLASLRYRLGRRLESAGLVMDWAVEDLPPLEWLNPPDALQVLRIVQEVLTNVLKHAQARNVRIATACDGSEVKVLVEDDGVGFDPASASRGRGLSHLRQRAARLGGSIEIESTPGAGTRVRLNLALKRGFAS